MFSLYSHTSKGGFCRFSEGHTNVVEYFSKISEDY